MLNQLYKHTADADHASASTWWRWSTACRGRSACKELIHHYVGHQREVVTRRTQYELRRAEARAHILEGLLIALDNLDAVIELIRGSADPDAARDGPDRASSSSPRSRRRRSSTCASQRLTALESDKVRAEHAELIERIAELRAILGDEPRIDGLVKSTSSTRSPSATATSAAPRSPTSRATSTSRT